MSKGSSFAEAISKGIIEEANSKAGEGKGADNNQANANANDTPQTNASGQQAGDTGDAPPASDAGGTQLPAEMSLSKYFKEKHGLELSDEAIIERIKAGGALGPAASSNQSAQPQQPEVTDDEIVAALEKSGKTRDHYNRVKELKAKSDYDVVRMDFAEELKAENPEITDEEIDDLLKERYFLGDDVGIYKPHEIAIGKKALAADANRIREKEGSPVESIRTSLLTQKQKEVQRQQHQAAVEAFLSSSAPKAIQLKVGKRGNNELGEYSFPVSPETHQKVSEIIKTPDGITKYLSGPDGKLDLPTLYSLFLNNEVINNFGVSLADHYYGKGVEFVKSTLNSYPNPNVPAGNSTKKDDVEVAVEHNRKQVSENVGRRRGM